MENGLCPNHSTCKHDHSSWDHLESSPHSLFAFSTFPPTKTTCVSTASLRMEQAQSYWISNTVKPDLRTDRCVAWSPYPPTSWWPQTWLLASWAHGQMASVASVTEPFPRKQTTATPHAKTESTPPTPNLEVPPSPSKPQSNDISLKAWAFPYNPLESGPGLLCPGLCPLARTAPLFSSPWSKALIAPNFFLGPGYVTLAIP